jgi:hypothetical protein
VAEDSHVFGQKFPAEESCIVMMQQPVVLLPKFGAKSLHIFMQAL